MTHCKDLVRLWDGTDGRLRVGPVKIPEANWAVRFSPNGRRWVAIGTDSQVFNTESGQAVAPPLVHHGRYRSVASGLRTAIFSPDGKKIVTTTWNQFLNVWEVDTGRLIQSVPLQSSAIPERHEVCYSWAPLASVGSPDGAFHVIARTDGQLVLWETGRWQLMQVIGDLQTFTSSPVFSPDGKRLYFLQAGAFTGSRTAEPSAPAVEDRTCRGSSGESERIRVGHRDE